MASFLTFKTALSIESLSVLFIEVDPFLPLIIVSFLLLKFYIIDNKDQKCYESCADFHIEGKSEYWDFYDYVIIIWPKGETYLNAVGCHVGDKTDNRISVLLQHDIVGTLKQNNDKVCYMQEGPSWFFNDYGIPEQFTYYNQIASSDIIFAHNEHDTKWYRGLFPNKDVRVLPSLMVETNIKDLEWKPED